MFAIHPGRETFAVLVRRLLREAGERGVRVGRRDLQEQVSTASGEKDQVGHFGCEHSS